VQTALVVLQIGVGRPHHQQVGDQAEAKVRSLVTQVVTQVVHQERGLTVAAVHMLHLQRQELFELSGLELPVLEDLIPQLIPVIYKYFIRRNDERIFYTN
jgi:hypothetical protein